MPLPLQRLVLLFVLSHGGAELHFGEWGRLFADYVDQDPQILNTPMDLRTSTEHNKDLHGSDFNDPTFPWLNISQLAQEDF